MLSAGSGEERLRVAVIGSGVAGLSAAWLLGERHDVTLYEDADRLGGHSNTAYMNVESGSIPVDTGFIVYNETTYPNLTALFRHLDVDTKPSDMSFAVSLDRGGFEYSSTHISALMAGGRNLFSPRFLSMIADLYRFYKKAPSEIAANDSISLEDFLRAHRYGEGFARDHLLPQAAAIWSASVKDIRKYPACAFIRFFENHGLMKFGGRPQWRTVCGGSQAYVKRIAPALEKQRLSARVTQVRRAATGVFVHDAQGGMERFDSVLIAAHADQALAMLAQPTANERALLGAFRYSRNEAVLHGDASFMPKRRSLWASWNYVGGDSDEQNCTVTYWMNLLQSLNTKQNLFVTLNPPREPDAVFHRETYEHPLFDTDAIRAQQRLWTLQGKGGVYFAGSYFGSGFHEDALQAGLLAAEQLGGVRRPWIVPEESGRITTAPSLAVELAEQAA